jgi:tetratricopeptide (TPR) repeat protein
VIRRTVLLAAVLFIFSACSALAGANESIPALISSGSVDQAITALRNQVTQSPTDAVAHNLLCRAYFALGDWDRGIAECEKAVSLAPAESRYHLWLGRAYGEKADRSGWMTAAGLAKHVRSEFELAVRLDPSNVDARSDLAEFYLEAPGIVGGGRDKAEQQADLLRSFDRARAYWINGRIAEKEHDLSEAETEYKKAIEASNGSAAAWLNLGLFYRHRERWDDMEKALMHVRGAPLQDRPDALVDAAEILLRAQRNLQEAVQLLRAYLKSDSKDEQAPAFKAHYLLGSAAEKMGDKEMAASEYRSALSLARDFRPAQEALQRLNR